MYYEKPSKFRRTLIGSADLHRSTKQAIFLSNYWLYSVVVITFGFDPDNPGSNPGTTYFLPFTLLNFIETFCYIKTPRYMFKSEDISPLWIAKK